MDMCLLCLELREGSAEGIKVTSTKWREEKIDQLIEKHFWSLKSITTNSWLCSNCWEVLNEFHKFYVQVEDAHVYFVSMLKIEMLESNDIAEIDTNNDLSNLTKTEQDYPKLTINVDEEDKPLFIKKEINHEELPISVEIEVPPLKTGLKRKDPLEKPLTNRNRKIRKLFKACKEKLEETCEIIAEEQTIDTDNDETPTSPADFDVEYKNSSDSAKETDNDASNSKSGKLACHKPRTKRNDLDEFLAKNFNIVCAICQAPMKTFHELCKHFDKIHNKRGYVTCCNKKFVRRSVLVDHIHRHLDPEYFKCKNCGKIMSDRRCLELHLKVHEVQDKKHVCNICGRAFSRSTVLKNHKLLIHLSDDEKKYPCEECGKLFGNNSLLSNHVRIVHLNKYALVCDICGKKMRSKDVFDRHILKHKGVALPTISCDICGLKMADGNSLKRHKASLHPEGGKRDYHCHICSKISPSLRAHKRHVQYKHEMGYDFKCTICDKAFKRSCSLTEHMATHTGTVLYTCPYCPKTFNSNANMHSHRKKAHPKEWEEACRAKYSGNLPPNHKPAVADVVLVKNDIATTLQ